MWSLAGECWKIDRRRVKVSTCMICCLRCFDSSVLLCFALLLYNIHWLNSQYMCMTLLMLLFMIYTIL